LKNIDRSSLDPIDQKYLDIITQWNLKNDPLEKGPTVFVNWWDSLQQEVFFDELNQTSMPVIKPENFVLLEALNRDSSFKFIDDIRTNKLESLGDVVTSSFKKAAVKLREADQQEKLEWAKFKNTTVYHLLRTGALPFARGGLLNGGGKNIINATTHDHGPSWRMVVHMTDEVEAYAVYPGGQQGNPGSKYYDNFIDTWTKGEYYRIWIMSSKDKEDQKVKWKMIFRT
jgi:penicillin amidase